MLFRNLLLGFLLSAGTLFASDSMSDIYTRAYFQRMKTFLDMNVTVYHSPAQIRKKYPKAKLWENTSLFNVRFMITEDPNSDAQVICIRGTHNFVNAWLDAHYFLQTEPFLGVMLHRGFNKASREILSILLPELDKKRKVVLTGHSMGGAISVILAMYLDKLGYEIHQVITQGMPKVTNKTGTQVYKDLPILRIANQGDLVPYLPPAYVTRYRHFGHKLELRIDGGFSYIVPGAQNRLDNDPGEEPEKVRELWQEIRKSANPEKSKKFDELYESEREALLDKIIGGHHKIENYFSRVENILENYPFPEN